MKRILVVEDHTDTRNVLMMGLRFAGFEVVGARTAYEALDLIHEEPFDLVLSDVGLPGYDGLSLLREVSGEYHIPCISMSGFSAYETGEASREAGCVAHLVKPMDLNELLDLVTATTAESESV
jgi:two-component system response regulator FlrC